MSEPLLLSEVLDVQRVKELSSSKVAFNYNSTALVEQAGSLKSQLVFLDNGDYEVSRIGGTKHKIKVEQLSSNDLTKEWTILFPEGSGAPSDVTLKQLISLHKHTDDRIKYFSGTAVYKKTIVAPEKSINPKRRIFLDLGQVEVIAEVILNGTNLGILWSRPYKIDITKALIAGENQLEIKVTNQWPNRLIGDEQVTEPYQYTPAAGGNGFASLSSGGIVELPVWYRNGLPKPDDGKITFATWKHYQKDSPLLEAGLIGPVVLKTGIVWDADR
jgi:hypothetical protein